MSCDQQHGIVANRSWAIISRTPSIDVPAHVPTNVPTCALSVFTSCPIAGILRLSIEREGVRLP